MFEEKKELDFNKVEEMPQKQEMDFNSPDQAPKSVEKDFNIPSQPKPMNKPVNKEPDYQGVINKLNQEHNLTADKGFKLSKTDDPAYKGVNILHPTGRGMTPNELKYAMEKGTLKGYEQLANQREQAMRKGMFKTEKPVSPKSSLNIPTKKPTQKQLNKEVTDMFKNREDAERWLNAPEQKNLSPKDVANVRSRIDKAFPQVKQKPNHSIKFDELIKHANNTYFPEYRGEEAAKGFIQDYEYGNMDENFNPNKNYKLTDEEKTYITEQFKKLRPELKQKEDLRNDIFDEDYHRAYGVPTFRDENDVKKLVDIVEKGMGRDDEASIDVSNNAMERLEELVKFSPEEQDKMASGTGEEIMDILRSKIPQENKPVVESVNDEEIDTALDDFSWQITDKTTVGQYAKENAERLKVPYERVLARIKAQNPNVREEELMYKYVYPEENTTNDASYEPALGLTGNVDEVSQIQKVVDDQIKKFGRIGGGLYDELDQKGYYLDSNDKVHKKDEINYESIVYPKGTSKEYTMKVNADYQKALPILEKYGIRLEDFGGRSNDRGGYEDNSKEIMDKYVFEPFRKKYPSGNNEIWEREYKPLYEAIDAVLDKNYNDWWIRNK